MTIGDFREMCSNSEDTFIKVYNLNNNKILYKGRMDYADSFFDCSVETFEIEDGYMIFNIDFYEEDEENY